MPASSACSQLHLLLAKHRAPEQADPDFRSRGSHTDVWGFATTILHLATRQLPYQGLTWPQTLTALTIKRRPPTVPATLPEWMRHLLDSCLSFDVAARPSAAQLLQVSSPFKVSLDFVSRPPAPSIKTRSLEPSQCLGSAGLDIVRLQVILVTFNLTSKSCFLC